MASRSWKEVSSRRWSPHTAGDMLPTDSEMQCRSGDGRFTHSGSEALGQWQQDRGTSRAFWQWPPHTARRAMLLSTGCEGSCGRHHTRPKNRRTLRYRVERDRRRRIYQLTLLNQGRSTNNQTPTSKKWWCPGNVLRSALRKAGQQGALVTNLALVP